MIKERNYFPASAGEGDTTPNGKLTVSGEVNVSGSKSESNRLLILQSLFPGISLKNLSNSDDTRYLKRALESQEPTVDIGHAGIFGPEVAHIVEGVSNRKSQGDIFLSPFKERENRMVR